MTIHIGRNALVAIAATVLLGVGAAVAGLVPAGQLLWLGLVLVCPIAMLLMMRGMGHEEPHKLSAPDIDPNAR